MPASRRRWSTLLSSALPNILPPDQSCSLPGGMDGHQGAIRGGLPSWQPRPTPAAQASSTACHPSSCAPCTTTTCRSAAVSASGPNHGTMLSPGRPSPVCHQRAAGAHRPRSLRGLRLFARRRRRGSGHGPYPRGNLASVDRERESSPSSRPRLGSLPLAPGLRAGSIRVQQVLPEGHLTAAAGRRMFSATGSVTITRRSTSCAGHSTAPAPNARPSTRTTCSHCGRRSPGTWGRAATRPQHSRSPGELLTTPRTG